MKKSLVSLVLALFALGSTAVFGQVPEKCKNLTGDAQKKCIDDEKMKKSRLEKTIGSAMSNARRPIHGRRAFLFFGPGRVGAPSGEDEELPMLTAPAARAG
jgi:hypothetical protein